MFRSLYNWTFRLSHHRHAIRALGAVSFCESSFFPIPPDVILVPVVLANREKAWWIATVCTIASVMGAALGYAIGMYLYDSVGRWLIQVYGMSDSIEQFRHQFRTWGTEIILIKGLTPIPFKIVTIASGIAHFNFAAFLAAATATRAARFFLIAWLLKRHGVAMRDFIERRLNLVGWTVLALLAVGFGVLAFL